MTTEDAIQLGGILGAAAFSLYSTVQSLVTKAKAEAVVPRLQNGNAAFRDLRETDSAQGVEIAELRTRLASVESRLQTLEEKT